MFPITGRRQNRWLARMPERIKTVDEQPWKDAGIRKMRVNKYYIYFLVDDAEMQSKSMP